MTSKRYIGEMAEMYGLPNELYTMKRGLKQKGKLRYDITILPPLIINGQYNKTKGHIHSTRHNELYKVLEGEAIFILQYKDKFMFTRVKKGEEFLVLGNCYHATINPTKKILKMCNWISDKCISNYKYIEKKKGMMYYYTTKGWVKNKNYD